MVTTKRASGTSGLIREYPEDRGRSTSAHTDWIPFGSEKTDSGRTGAATYGSPDVGGRQRPTEAIPRMLEDLEPGPVLAALLSSIDVHRVSGHDRIVVLSAHQRMASHYQAQLYRDMASMVEVFADSVSDGDILGKAEAAMSAEAEIRLALGLTRRTAESELSFALELRNRLPEVFALMVAGQLDVRRARTIERHTCDLPVDIARRVVAAILDRATGLTTGQLAAELRRLRIEVDAEEAEHRYRSAIDDRRVFVEPTPDGAANLHALNLPAARAASIMQLIDDTARRLPPDASDTRTIDQKRADVFLDLTDPREPNARRTRRGTVDILVDLDTLAELQDHPGELAGYGPVIADIARQVGEAMHDGEWRYTATHPTSRQPIVVGTTGVRPTNTRRPNAAQKRLVETRDRTCVFPGCRHPAGQSDIDHTTPWSQSHITDTADLAPLCRHDHGVRHLDGFRYEHLDDGDYRWSTPSGHTYTTSGRSP